MKRRQIRNLVNKYVLTLKRYREYDIDDWEAEEIVPDVTKRIVHADLFDTEELYDIFVSAVEDYVERKFRNDDISDVEIRCLCHECYDSVSNYADVIYGNAIIEMLGELMIDKLSYIEIDYDELDWELKTEIEDFAFKPWYEMSETVSSFKFNVILFFYELVEKYEDTHIRYRFKR